MELCDELCWRTNLSGKITHPLFGHRSPSFNLLCFNYLVCCTNTLFWPREEVGEEIGVKGKKGKIKGQGLVLHRLLTKMQVVISCYV